ncbi:DUF805 domain-containing protein [Cutibacterium sp.]|uniref:DUF805 domain-containing protein n=1 Tax=Cutibacterium sp. TaxID=1912221 RepID=UPI0026DB3F6D|nr:DUF805 domain-containing protein [Cutibacterium sp.]MDO4412116.1 DUF805 domain-containing protein [Cutibacterium sp.]
MSFGRAIKLFFKNYAVFRGRASRSEYWWTFLFLVLVSSVLEAINAVTASPGHESSLYLVLYAIWGLGTLIPSLAIQVRRLHDTNRSGWWVLINLIPLVGQIWILIYFLLDSHPDAWQTYDKEPLPATE